MRADRRAQLDATIKELLALRMPRLDASDRDARHFAKKCRAVDGHTIWQAGSQFRFSSGWRCSPTQAAYLFRMGIARLPAGFAAVRTCGRENCVEHVECFPRGMMARLRPPRAILDPKEIEWLLSIPRLTFNRSPKERRLAVDAILILLGHRVSRHYISSIRTPTRRRELARVGRIK